MSANNLFDIDIRAYISGILVPVSNISVTSSFNAIPTCTLSLPPHAELYSIGRNDRIPVQVFISNTFCEKPDDFILLFEGEVTGFGYRSTDFGRELTINTQHYGAFLKDMHMRVMRTLDDFALSTVSGAKFSGANSSSHVDFTYPGSLFTKGLGNFQEDNLIDYPQEFLDNAITFAGSGGNALMDFFKQYLDDIRATQRWVPVPIFDDGDVTGADGPKKGFPLLHGMQRGTTLSQLVGMASDGPQMATLYDLLNYIAQNMEFELAMIPNPTYSGRLASILLKPMFYEAVPPVCNIIPRALTSQLDMQERTHGTPTRVVTRNVSGVANGLAHGGNSVVKQFAISDCYPPRGGAPREGKADFLVETLLDYEQRTGPFVYETQMPIWYDFVNPETAAGDSDIFRDSLMRHLYTLKRYERRRGSVSMGLSPFVVAGFPALVFTAENTGLDFVGQVLTVSHNINKQAASTQLELGFMRTLAEERSIPLENTLKSISDNVTHDYISMSEVYGPTIGCHAEDVIHNPGYVQAADAHKDPLSAYKYTERSICTQEEYADFMGYEIAKTDLDSLNRVRPTQYTGPRLTDRFDSALIEYLKGISDHVRGTEIYFGVTPT